MLDSHLGRTGERIERKSGDANMLPTRRVQKALGNLIFAVPRTTASMRQASHARYRIQQHEACGYWLAVEAIRSSHLSGER